VKEKLKWIKLILFHVNTISGKINHPNNQLKNNNFIKIDLMKF